MESADDVLLRNQMQSKSIYDIIAKDMYFLRCYKYAVECVAQVAVSDGLIFVCGNGGSWDDADHVASELIGWYKDKTRQRPALPVIPLPPSPGALTAIANDIGYEHVFSRPLSGFIRPAKRLKDSCDINSVLLAFSTSGKSPNVLQAAELAYKNGIQVVSFTGKTGGSLKRYSHRTLCVPSRETDRIQEVHHALYHTLCEIVEQHVLERMKEK
jgi:D-sedoheptulose 7-phosphate isomerase